MVNFWDIFLNCPRTGTFLLLTGVIITILYIISLPCVQELTAHIVSLTMYTVMYDVPCRESRCCTRWRSSRRQWSKKTPPDLGNSVHWVLARYGQSMYIYRA